MNPKGIVLSAIWGVISALLGYPIFVPNGISAKNTLIFFLGFIVILILTCDTAADEE